MVAWETLPTFAGAVFDATFLFSTGRMPLPEVRPAFGVEGAGLDTRIARARREAST